MKQLLLHIILFFLFTNATLGQVQLEPLHKSYEAGTTIVLKFKNLTKPTAMYCSNSYSNTLVFPEIQKEITQYTIPLFITKKTGWLYWELSKPHQKHSGRIDITPIKKAHKIETYLGPPSILAGFDEKSMIVTIPTDSLNNPLSKGTPVKIKKSLNGTTNEKIIKTDGLFAYSTIYGGTKTNRALITSECLNLTSKELSLEITPSTPTDFSIFYNRIHQYADGNQITSFYTSTIKDRYDNIIADGTIVNFTILDKKGNLLQTQGISIRGVATCQMVHPDHQETWTVHAFIDKFCQSNSIQIEYIKAVKDFPIRYKKDQMLLVAGPFKSFMSQILPDGLMVHLNIYHQEELVNSFTVQSEKGFANFKLKNILEPNKEYKITVRAAEISKELKIKN